MATTKKATSSKTADDFAVIRAGGQQFVVRQGDMLNTEKLDGEYKEGDTMSFDDVLLTVKGGNVTVGTPTVAGGKVTAEFVKAGRYPKVVVIKYKAKARQFKKNGHRQPFMTWKITAIA